VVAFAGAYSRYFDKPTAFLKDLKLSFVGVFLVDSWH
jgi:hypothetical protein